jgi:hypothetical protein
MNFFSAEGKMLEEVDAEMVAEVVAKWTGVPVSRLQESESAKLVKMEDRLRSRVVGQDEALLLVANAVRRARSGLSDPNRPIGSFIFLGPTGVGKTETAGPGRVPNDDDQAIVRTERGISEKHTVARLLAHLPVTPLRGGKMINAPEKTVQHRFARRNQGPSKCSTSCSRCWMTAVDRWAGALVDFRDGHHRDQQLRSRGSAVRSHRLSRMDHGMRHS